MSAWLLVLLCSSPALAADGYAVSVATAPSTAAADAKTLTARLGKLSKPAAAAEYAAVRLVLLEDLALLQEWAERAKTPAEAFDAFDRVMTAEGRAALGKRKPLAADFADRPGSKKTLRSGGLSFQKP